MVKLVPMKKSDFENYLETSVKRYAQEHVRSGNWTEDNALDLAQRTFDKLLPEGLKTPNHYLFNIEKKDTNKAVGMLWFAEEERQEGKVVFLYDIQVYPDYRRQGFGSQGMKRLEEKVRELNLNKIMFHVFGHNHSARAMYEKLGYEVKNLIMAKELDN